MTDRATTAAEWEAAERKAAALKRKQNPRCTLCGRPGHNLRTCPEAWKRSERS